MGTLLGLKTLSEIRRERALKRFSKAPESRDRSFAKEGGGELVSPEQPKRPKPKRGGGTEKRRGDGRK